MKKHRPQMKCPNCEGSGMVDIGEGMQAALDKVPSTGTITAEEVHSKLGEHINVTAVNNRLVYLFQLGLVTRRRDGKFWRYSRA